MKLIKRIFNYLTELPYKFDGKDAKFFFSIVHNETHPQYGTVDEALGLTNR